MTYPLTASARRRLAVLAFAAAATAAHGQSLELACATTAAAGDPATPVTLTTGPGWDIRYGTGGTWGAATTTYRHSHWLTPTTGTWLTPGDPIAGDVASALPFFYRSPAIQVGSRVDLASITVTIQQAADNYYDATGILNTGTPAAGTMVTYGGTSSFSALSTAFTPALAWATGANQILLEARNEEADHTSSTPTGVYATMTVTATCRAAPQPAAVPADAPWALLLAGLGLAGVAARRLRRR